MGEAKRRGAFEERKASAIARQKVKKEFRLKVKAEVKATETPEQKTIRHRALIELMTMLGMGGAYHRLYPIRKDERRG